MPKSTIFSLERSVHRRGGARTRTAHVDPGHPIDLRYAWDAFPPAPRTHAASWHTALHDRFPDDPDTADLAGAPPSTLPASPPDPPPSVPPPEAVPGPAPHPSDAAPDPLPRQPDAAVEPAPRRPAAPPASSPPAPSPSEPAHEPATAHDDRFTRALSSAARGEVVEDAPAQPDSAAPQAPTRTSHGIFDQLGERLSQATTFHAGTFEATELFERLDREIAGRPPPTMAAARTAVPEFDVVDDLATILEVPADELRQRLSPDGADEEDPDLSPSPASSISVATSAPPIERLQRYLGVDDARFRQDEARYFSTLKEHLVRVGAATADDAVDRDTFAGFVEAFQRTKRGLGHDGIPGEDTLWELQASWAEARELAIVRVDADVWLRPPLTEADYHPDDHGYRSFRLREDVASRYDALRREVLDAGAILTSSGSLRDLDAVVTSGRSSTSMHYPGLALDLATPTGMRDPDVDPYVITRDGDGWRVWARAAEGSKQRLDAVVWSDGGTTERTVTAPVVDLTALMGRHGFHPIPPRSGFPASYLSAEWWHFQCTDVLVPWISQFGIELMSLATYDEARLRRAAGIWANRKAIHQRLPAARGWR